MEYIVVLSYCTRRHTVALFGLGVVVSVSLARDGWAQSTTRPQPNVVFILADDLGIGDVARYNPASKIPTPHIDRLAAEGMHFTDAHAAASTCTPTRYGILTGRYPWRTWLQRGVLRPWGLPLIERGRMTVGSLLGNLGYHTAAMGKWHLGWLWPFVFGQPRFDRPIAEGPTTRGFKTYFGVDVPNYPPYVFIKNNFTVGIPSAMKETRDLDGRQGPMLPGWQFEDILPTITQHAVRYIRERATEQRPFFLYFALTSPHEPIAPLARFIGMSGISPLADFIIETDWAVGEIMNAIDQNGLSNTTLIFFASDNGHASYTGLEALLAAGHNPSAPFRGLKGDIWEGGHRIPFIVRYPGVVPAGAVSHELVSLNTLLATVAELVETPLPANAGEDSFSILPVLRNIPRSGPTHPAVIHQDLKGNLAIRRGSWKLISWKSGLKQLFNLAQDRQEQWDVAAQNPTLVAELSTLLSEYKQDGRSRPAK
jgi:arylsulfatase A